MMTSSFPSAVPHIPKRMSAEILTVCFLLTLLVQMALWQSATEMSGQQPFTQVDLQGSIPYKLVRPPLIKLDEVDSLTPNYPSTFVRSLVTSFRNLLGSRNSKPFHSRYLITPAEPKDFYRIGNVDTVQNVTEGDVQLQNALDDLLSILTTTKRTCRKLVRFGGGTCRGKRDGAKMVCMDPGIQIESDRCLVYSFGIGHDFSFDEHISLFGCQVYSFDCDKSHQDYPTVFSSGIRFIKIRLGYIRHVEMLTGDRGTERLVFRPLHNIVSMLRHDNRTFDIIKVDIEGNEWKVFDRNILKTKILERTKQLSLEIHLHYYLKRVNVTHRMIYRATRYYKRILKGIESKGFSLAHYEPNYFAPKVREVAGRRFQVYCETLWINENFRDHLSESFVGNLYDEYEYPPKIFEYHTNDYEIR